VTAHASSSFRTCPSSSPELLCQKLLCCCLGPLLRSWKFEFSISSITIFKRVTIVPISEMEVNHTLLSLLLLMCVPLTERSCVYYFLCSCCSSVSFFPSLHHHLYDWKPLHALLSSSKFSSSNYSLDFLFFLLLIPHHLISSSTHHSIPK
jgi:hypothetical protein